ncbi:MAG: restriction endonuclease subunit R [Pseudanabaena frigida]|uniref:Restriction endonuclease subunit R n=1 Tax=Pseudanabaena frigida TaxID=945775 RepID=A0A2W4WKR4_9CYAN|nr:MAG: restriction endonuclease subunit R [Pseudanabaena frigida]
MAFTEDIAKLSEQVRKRLEHIQGEEATKQALILPFFTSLGYDIYDPTEVKPEYISDAATKRAGQFEKVDYAIRLNNAVVMVVEAKAVNEKLVSHDGQLRRYFTWTETAKVGIVTNGKEYRFFTDLRAENIMDEDPFFSFNILDYTPKDLENLKFFHRDNFDPAAITYHAEEIVYTKGITKQVSELLRNPSEDFIRLLLGAANLTDSRITKNVIEKFKPIVKKSIQNSLVDLISISLNQEIQAEPEVSLTEITLDPPIDSTETSASKIITTPEELEAFAKIQSFCKPEISHKDTASYFSIHLGNSTWWFVRLYFSNKKKNIIVRLPLEETKPLANNLEVQDCSGHIGSAATRVYISSINDLDQLAPLIQKACETEASKH